MRFETNTFLKVPLSRGGVKGRAVAGVCYEGDNSLLTISLFTIHHFTKC